jgi:hypothetical protein
MTNNILTHPKLRTNSTRMIRALKADIQSKLERATDVLSQAISTIESVDVGIQQADMGEIAKGLGMVREALSRIDLVAPPHSEVLMRLARATDGLLSQFSQVSRVIQASRRGGGLGGGPEGAVS